MAYSIEPGVFDLGTTPIENLFFHYLPTAPDGAVKLYLYVYAGVYAGETIWDDMLCEQMGKTPEEVAKLWGYWEEAGLVRRTYASDGSYDIEFLSLRGLFLENLKYTSPARNVELETFAPKSVTESADNEMTRMLREVEEILGTTLRPAEVDRIVEDINQYGVSPDLVAMAFHYSFETLDKKDFHYALGVLRKWYLARVYTVDDLTRYLADKEAEKEKKKTTAAPKLGVQPVETRYTDDEMARIIEEKIRKSREE